MSVSVRQTGSLFWNGTRFRLFAEAPFRKPFDKPETITVSSRAGSVGPCPGDDRIYVVDPIGKQLACGLAENLRGDPFYLMPPWPGSSFSEQVRNSMFCKDHKVEKSNGRQPSNYL